MSAHIICRLTLTRTDFPTSLFICLFNYLFTDFVCRFKVEVSLDNLRDVIDERNTALSLLETGEPPHPKWIDDTDELDRPIRRLETEHLIPKEHNEEFLYVIVFLPILFS